MATTSGEKLDALIANPDTEQMTALLKEVMDGSPPDPNQLHQERERILAAWRGRHFASETMDPMLAAAWERIIHSWFDDAYDRLLNPKQRADTGRAPKRG